MNFTKVQWKQLRSEANKVFKAKERQRRIDSRKPMTEKIYDLKIIQDMSLVK